MRSSNRNGSIRRATSMALESMEARSLLSVSIQSGVYGPDSLLIQGDSKKDVIAMTMRPDANDPHNENMDLVANGTKFMWRNGTAPHYITIRTGGGNDKVTLDDVGVYGDNGKGIAITLGDEPQPLPPTTNVYVDTGSGNDTVIAGSSGMWTSVNLGAGKDKGFAVATLGSGDDLYLNGGAGNDTLYGSDGRDRLDGDDGNDKIYGFGGDDDLFGGAGNDTVSGGEGNDYINGGIGADNLLGGAGNDRFQADVYLDWQTQKVVNTSDGDKVDGGDDYDNYTLYVDSTADPLAVSHAKVKNVEFSNVFVYDGPKG